MCKRLIYQKNTPNCAGLGFFYSFRVEKAKDQKNVDVIRDKDSREGPHSSHTAERLLRVCEERETCFFQKRDAETQRETKKKRGDCVF